jgi:hypothetical protein
MINNIIELIDKLNELKIKLKKCSTIREYKYILSEIKDINDYINDEINLSDKNIEKLINDISKLGFSPIVHNLI